jgi:hypothetical protein
MAAGVSSLEAGDHSRSQGMVIMKRAEKTMYIEKKMIWVKDQVSDPK